MKLASITAEMYKHVYKCIIINVQVGHVCVSFGIIVPVASNSIKILFIPASNFPRNGTKKLRGGKLIFRGCRYRKSASFLSYSLFPRRRGRRKRRKKKRERERIFFASSTRRHPSCAWLAIINYQDENPDIVNRVRFFTVVPARREDSSEETGNRCCPFHADRSYRCSCFLVSVNIV